MDDQEDRENVISLELAFQRELAYRKKVAMLQLHPYGDSDEELLPLPVEFLSPCQSPTSTQIPDSSPGFTGVNQLVAHKRNPVVQQLQQIDVMQTLNGRKRVKLANSVPSRSLSGMKRAAGPSNLEPRPSLWLQQVGDQQTANSSNCDLVCEICQVSCSGRQPYKQHIGGKKHQLKLQEATRRKVFEQREWCSLCKIWCMKSALKQHTEGQRHQRKLCIG